MKKLFLFCLSALIFTSITAQQFYEHTPEADKWVRKQFRKLSKDQRIAQLMIIRAHSNLGADHVKEVTDLIKKYNVGGLCFFQGGPVRQANLTNEYQKIAKTPLMIAIDGEWGLGMRLDSVINFPRQLMMGAVPDAKLIYQFGLAVGEQCKRIGIHVNYAPDIDINNNPMNPVINDRSFGEDKYKVALFGVQYMKGMQDVGVMACAKHFPGHGDVSVDSHYDLPVINKTRAQLDELELYPFRELIKAGVGSMMIAHLAIPSIDTTTNLPTSLSAKNVTDLLRNELGYQGISFTDALEMQGVAKFFPKGDASVMSLIAGNDMLCLPGDIPGSIQKVRQAIKEGKLTWDDLNARVKKVLLAKYHLGLHKKQVINTENLAEDLNAKTNEIKKLLAANALTLLRKSNDNLLPLKATKVAFVGIGINKTNAFATRVQQAFNADLFFFENKDTITKVNSILEQLKNYDAVVVGFHNYNRRPANQFGLSKNSLDLLNKLQGNNTITFAFGNPYAVQYICNSNNLVVCYEDDEITQQAAADLLMGKINAKGKLPVTVCEGFRFGDGIVYDNILPLAKPETVGMQGETLQQIEAIAKAAIDSGAAPGMVVLAAKNGKVVYHQAFGYTNTDRTIPMNNDMVFDLASVTKISSTTMGIMKLYEEGKIDLNKTLGDYLSWTKGTDKAPLKLVDILLHQAGLNPFIPFYREVIDTATGIPFPQYFTQTPTAQYSYRVAENVYLRNDWRDTMFSRILSSKLTEQGKYVYSDNDFIFLGQIIEAVSGMSLDNYVRKTFYEPLGMTSTMYKPRESMPLSVLVPTEVETHFRKQQMHGDVHDEGAAMFGGVAGHAGLFSNAYDLAKLYQLLLNGGELNGIRLLNKATIDKFTAYQSEISRRGLGFDKPEKDNATRKEPYPSLSVSPATFGHTGFTGTCVWVDPSQQLIYIFLSNRVNPSRNGNKLGRLNVRPNIQEAIYGAIMR
ncbi:MAG: serine hydrolase [Sediminibacterium sp. Gen4]|jgi:beta-glucosidase-like glycosyl hydrolase/CubicO group peptidase (beta-lactamase class C family)|uniref:glycoside hydrolase family 3 N-terminal domain-containing protein n=1 Tax=unclassified Sediminibacterium TaxID=2635961 RepID=UPI0015BB9A7B|nr:MULTISPECIES: glycoside hydrolase family 3 N-terminal domain-containing protein [unclassified Sediminibacterium]MBW0160337.1 serine hydrolase [Sediminibacterium sp.]MBW0163202.1 serine hydrolase [Sediminibacterium sp.]NWK65314.1 serine hydrolase [Sediminibacterium sp. Gen4]